MLLKLTRCIWLLFFSFPLAISSYFKGMPAVYTIIIDIKTPISAALIFTTFFYYPMRMIISPRYAKLFWRRHCLARGLPVSVGHLLSVLVYGALATILLRLRPYEADHCRLFSPIHSLFYRH